MFDVFYYGRKPNLFAFEQYAPSIEAAAAKCKTGYYWYIYGGNDYTGFDFNWRPAPWEHSHLHVWPSQHQRCGDVFLAHVDTHAHKQWHFRTEQSVKRLPYPPGWTIPDHIDPDSVDLTWHPDTTEGNYTYHFPSQHQSASGVYYTMLHTTGIKFSNAFTVTAVADKTHWVIPEEIKESTVDFSWHPNTLDPPYVYHFGSDYQQSIGLTYTVPGATNISFAGPMPTHGYHKFTAMQVLDIFFIDKGNPTAQVRYDRLNEVHNVTKVRYANSMMDTIKRCVTRSKTNKFWVVSSEYDYTGFDFHWHAEPWQQYMTHVFPSQHNKWSDTFLINKWEFNRHAEWAKGIEEFPNLNFVSDQSVTKPDTNCNMYFVDHGNPESELDYTAMLLTHPDMVKTRFANTYFDTFKRIMQNADTEYVWIINSICDYRDFDFTWEPEPWQREMIHCFSNESRWTLSPEKRGDTFYIHVESFKKQMVELELLDWFNVINYIDGHEVTRYPVPAVHYDHDNLINAIKNHNFATPYALFTKEKQFTSMTGYTTCLWTEKDRVAIDIGADKSTSLIPRDIKKYIKTQVYDYPHLVEHPRLRNMKAVKDLDIVFISNGEPDEQKWFEHTEYMSNRDVKWIRGVNGRVAAYQAAAHASTTDWFLAVFAKLEVFGNRDIWEFRPDYWQGPKHYIFNAKNPVNGLVYGHQGMIAYNKSLVLANNDPGIDFTLSQPHESVPILSGVAHYNQDAWTTWRTAFREVLKLRLFMDTQPTLETEHRLEVWRTVAAGKYSNYSIDGANDAVAYYEEVQGDLAKLQLSFEWAWLRARYNAKY